MAYAPSKRFNKRSEERLLPGAIATDKIESGNRRTGKDNRCGGWKPEPGICRVADGVPARVDRLRALGNAVVPQVAEFIGSRILEAVA